MHLPSHILLSSMQTSTYCCNILLWNSVSHFPAQKICCLQATLAWRKLIKALPFCINARTSYTHLSRSVKTFSTNTFSSCMGVSKVWDIFFLKIVLIILVSLNIINLMHMQHHKANRLTLFLVEISYCQLDYGFQISFRCCPEKCTIHVYTQVRRQVQLIISNK